MLYTVCRFTFALTVGMVAIRGAEKLFDLAMAN